MAKRLEGKVIVVTGAGSGIGRATALQLGRQGAKLGLLDVNEPTDVADMINAAGGDANALKCDVRSAEQVTDAIKSVVVKYGLLHGAANLAGVMSKFTMGGRYAEKATGQLIDSDDVEWDRMMAVNLGGVRNCMREELRHFSPDGCSIVNAASVAGQGPSPYNSAYGASKAAVISLTMSAAHEMGRRGVRVNAIAPGLVATPLVGHLSPEQMTALSERNALGRPGNPDEIANMIVFLLSDDSSYCTGTVYNVDAGRR